MVFQPQIFDFIDGDETVLEKKPLETVAAMCELKAYKHNGFWQCMDTLREKELLEKLIQEKQAPWMVWDK
jgi:glucose-1-phosphate cytidylyltransferase